MEEFLKLLKEEKLDRISSWHLTEVGNDVIDEDGDVFPTAVNTVRLMPDKRLVCYDESCENADDTVDEEDMYLVEELPDKVRKELLWSIREMRM